MTRAFCPVWVLAGLLLATAALAEPLTLDVHAMRQLAYTTLKAGYAQDALEYTDALLQRDPGDTTALTIRSQALRALGRADEARGAARLAWTSATTDPGRFGAAMAMAQAQSTEGRRTAAQWWLRRAAQNAPNARAEAIAKRDFGYVKSRNPWDLQINATAAPSSNVNNGSQQDTLTLAGLPFEFEIPEGSKALSGYEAGLGVRASYRFAPSGPDRQTKAVFGVLVQGVSLSSEAKRRAPDLNGSDFAYAAVEAGLSHRQGLDDAGITSLSFAGTVGHNWYGGDVLSDYLQVQVGLDHKLNDRSAVNVGISADRVVRVDSPVQSSDRVELALGYGRLVARDRVSVGVTAARALSDSDEVGHEAVGLTLSFDKAEPVAGVGLSATVAVEARDFAGSRYVTGGREDVKLTAILSMRFDQVDYMGFSPVLDLRATRNRSNAALYDTQDVGITLGIKSSF